MKKLIPFLLILAVAAGAIFYFARKEGVVSLHPRELAPAGSILYLELTDVPASRNRWKETSLAAILAEPEVKAFLDKPLSGEAARPLQGFSDFVQKLDPGSVFVSLASIDQNRPAFAAGFSTSRSKKEIDDALADARKRVQEKYPTGKAELVQHEGVSIESFVADDFGIAVAFDKGWYLIGSSVDLVKGMLDRAAKRGKDTFESTASVKTVLEKAPAKRESLLVLVPAPLIAKIKPTLSMTGQASGVNWEEIESIEALAAWTIFDGKNLREGIYKKQTGQKPKSALSQSAMALTTPQTLLYLTSLLQVPDKFELPGAGLEAVGPMAIASAFLAQMEARGISMDKVLQSLGKEAGMAMDWPAGAFYPLLSIRVDVKDRAPIAQLCQYIASGEAFGTPLNVRKVGESDLYEIPGIGNALMPLRPAFSLTGDALFIGSDAAKVEALTTGESGDGLETSDTYKKSKDLIDEPNRAFAYVDFKQLFERVYGLGRSFLVMGAGLMQQPSGTADMTKLPTTEAVSKHLGPIVYSERADDEGVLMESVGPITTHQLMVGVVGGSIYAALKQQGILQ